ncbi:hypothetical protein [Streptomyces sp. NBC_01089]|uniref:hypothetical protein n=1 Tax=Streptomyces sp. NBC_01089 TaxID=2903747 RepID=UPI00386680BE|nr:hypothetical protein OG510_20485 [Streptomyces sp. NBC_01089]
MLYLNFLHTTIELDVDAAAEAAFGRIRRFFRHLLDDTPRNETTFRVAVAPYDPDSDVDPAVWAVPESVVRLSSAREFTFHAHIVDDADRRSYTNRNMVLDAPHDAMKDPVFRTRVTERAAVQMIDFLRDLVIRNEEQQGTVVLHASGIHDGRRAVCIAGPKGAGKTTTMLSCLRRDDWSYFSGDKVFCTFDASGVTVHPWRDYPYVGVGTIRADKRLEQLVRDGVDAAVDTYEPGHKILIDPDVFEEWLGTPFDATPRPLAALFLPRVEPGEPLRARRLDSDNERWAHLNKIIDRQADTTFFTWQSYLVPDYTEFYRSLSRLRQVAADLPMVRLTGTLDVDPSDVLKNLDSAKETA